MAFYEFGEVNTKKCNSRMGFVNAWLKPIRLYIIKHWHSQFDKIESIKKSKSYKLKCKV